MILPYLFLLRSKEYPTLILKIKGVNPMPGSSTSIFSLSLVFLLSYVKESASNVEETVGQNRTLGVTVMPFIKEGLFLKGWKFPYSPSPKLNVL